MHACIYDRLSLSPSPISRPPPSLIWRASRLLTDRALHPASLPNREQRAPLSNRCRAASANFWPVLRSMPRGWRFRVRPRLARPLTLLPCKRHARRAQLLGGLAIAEGPVRSPCRNIVRSPSPPVVSLLRFMGATYHGGHDIARLENESETRCVTCDEELNEDTGCFDEWFAYPGAFTSCWPIFM